MKIADSHVHARCNVELTTKLLEDMHSVGVIDACLLALTYNGVAQNLFTLYMKENYKKVSLRAFGGFHVTDRYCTIAPEVQAKTVIDLGADGFKIMFSPDMQKFYGRGIDDVYYDKLFTYLEDNQIPVNVHLADPETFWDNDGNYCDGSFPSKQLMMEQAFNRLHKNPNLKVTFAHFMFLSNQPELAESVMEKYPFIRFDLTPGMEMYFNFDKSLEYWHDFFIKYQNRLLFGTDCNTVKTCNKKLVQLVKRKLTESYNPYVQNCYNQDLTMCGLNLPTDVVNKICYENYFDYLGTTAKPVDKDLFKWVGNKILSDLSQNPYDPYYIKGGQIIKHLQKDPNQQISIDFITHAIKTI